MNFTVLPRNWAPYTQALFRIMVGLLFLEHGTGKLLGFPAGSAPQMPYGMLIFTGAIELIGGALITIGFLTRPVAFILSGFTAAAYFMVHAPMGFFPILNHGELAIVYCFAFLHFAAAGAGAWSIDSSFVGSGAERDHRGDALSRA
jgi:putative oxidoreductase